MHSGSHQEVPVGMQQNVDYSQTQANGLQPIHRKLWGYKPRIVAGMVQIFTGVIEIFLGIVVVSLPSLGGQIRYSSKYDRLDTVGWGIWCGAFVILTGCFGICSQRKRNTVLVYMVMSVIASVMCASCIIGEVYSIKDVLYAKSGHWARFHSPFYHGSQYESDFDIPRATAHLILYIILLILFVIQGISSIMGASFTCRAVCNKTTNMNQRVVHYQPTQGPVLLSGPANPYVHAPVFVSGPAPPYDDASSSQPDPNLAFDPQYPTKN